MNVIPGGRVGTMGVWEIREEDGNREHLWANDLHGCFREHSTRAIPGSGGSHVTSTHPFVSRQMGDSVVPLVGLL